MTTNGSLLATQARGARAAGLRRVTVSLDSLDDAVFAQPQRRGHAGGAGASRASGGRGGRARPHQDQHGRPAGRQRGQHPAHGPLSPRAGLDILRFIEYMDVGHTNGWRMEEVVPMREILDLIDAEMPLEAVPPLYPGEVADRYPLPRRLGRGGHHRERHASRSAATCTRARLTAEGQLYLCLFGVRAHDLRAPLRSGADDDAVSSGSCAAPGSVRDRPLLGAALRGDDAAAHAWRCRTSAADRVLCHVRHGFAICCRGGPPDRRRSDATDAPRRQGMTQPTGQPGAPGQPPPGAPPPSWQQPPQQPRAAGTRPPPPQQPPSWTASLTSTAPIPGPAGYVYGDVPNRSIAYIIDWVVLFIIGLVISGITLGIFGDKLGDLTVQASDACPCSSGQVLVVRRHRRRTSGTRGPRCAAPWA